MRLRRNCLLAAMLLSLPWGTAAASGQDGAAPPATLTGTDARSRSLYLTLIRNLRRAGQVHAALAHLDAFDRQFPRSDDAALLRGDCLTDIARHAEAAAVFQKLTRGKQAAAAAYAGLGRIDALSERWAAAAANYALAVQRAPTMAAYLSDYGFVLLRAQRPRDAVFRLRQAVELDAGDARARNNLILALAASGDDAAARQLLATVADPQQKADLEAELARPAVAAATAQPAS
ncbi:tetratricopeptide repeat protein [Sphingomonas turrisvirgatae]|uniref:Uncharacterized protein n=1 Tax=Sphingomonas turrisvirgatae TaxID=1888892 RepID=A0A1E3LX25_9SPHN|nr:tetratricopeptide repeat protein [Sphingomonas turrisvirgatae]ODP37705.1 hypothetical protein BFL28_01625 [Sphingomonas turrisvirgatae]